MNRFERVYTPLSTPLKWFITLMLAAFVAACGGGVEGGPAGPTVAGGSASLLGSSAVVTDSHDSRGTKDPKDTKGGTPVVDPTNPGGTPTTAGQAPVNLGTAGNFAILSKSGISTVPNSAVTGDIGVSPIDQTALTGFSQTMDSTNTFARSDQVVGKLYAADYTPPAPVNMTTAISDMETAYTDAAGRTLPGFTELGAGQIGGLTLVPGLYKWGTDVAIPTNVTLSGGPNDVWIFQVAGNLTQAAATRVTLIGGALAKNIFWQVSGATVIGTTAHFEGVVLSKTAINLQTGASANGRLLAQTAVTLDQSTVTQPAP